MLIKRLKLINYGCHEEADLVFTEGINAVLGENGSGKSTILDALRFGLLGESGFDGAKAENVRWGADTAKVVVEFSHGDTAYSITRTLGKRDSQVLRAEGLELTKKKEIEEFIEQLCGASIDALCNNVFVQQGRIDSILFSTNTKRLKEIQETVGLQRAADAEKLLGIEAGHYTVTQGLKQQIDIATEAMLEARAEREAKQQLIDELTATINRYQPYSLMLDDFRRRQQNSVALQQIDTRIAALELGITRLEGEEAELRHQCEALSGMAKGLGPVAKEARVALAQHEADKRIVKAAEETRHQLELVEAGLTKLGEPPTGNLTELELQLTDLTTKVVTRRDQLAGKLPWPKHPKEDLLLAQKQELAEKLRQLREREPAKEEILLQQRISVLRTELERFKDGKCPTCGQSVTGFDPHERENELVMLEAELAQLTLRLSEEWCAKRQDWTQLLNEIGNELESLTTAARTAIKGSLDKLTTTVQTLTAQRDTLRKYHTTRDSLTSRKALLEKQLSSGAAVPLDEAEVSKLLKLVEDYDKLSVSIAERSTSLKAKTAELGHRRNDLAEARTERASIGEVAELPSTAEIEDAKEKVRFLAEAVTKRTATVGEHCAANIRVEQHEALIDALRVKEQEEERDAAWVSVCRHAREVLHVNGLPSLIIREYAKLLNRGIAYYMSVWEAPFSLELDDTLAFTATFSDGRVLPGYRLSGGQRIVASTSFRLAMAATFAKQVGLLILDEPSNHLDSNNIIHLQQLLLRLKELAGSTGRQVIMVDHEESLVGFFDNVITLRAKRPEEEQE